MLKHTMLEAWFYTKMLKFLSGERIDAYKHYHNLYEKVKIKQKICINNLGKTKEKGAICF